MAWISGPSLYRQDPADVSGTLPELFLDRVSRSGDRMAVTFYSQAVETWNSASWNAMAQDVLTWAEALRSEVKPREHVVLVSENRYEWMVVDLAIQFLGAVTVPLHPHATATQIQELVAHSGASVAVVSSEPQFRKLCPDGASGRVSLKVFAFEELAEVPVEKPRLGGQKGKDSPVETLRRLDGLLTESSLAAGDLVSILYTSGTTGEPKGVMLSHRNVLANVASKLQTLPLAEDDVRLVWLPMSHIFSRVCDLYTAYAAGCQSVLSRGREELWDELKRFQPTYLNGVPYFFEKAHRLVEQAGRLADPKALPELLGGRMQLCNCGGAPLPDHVFDSFRHREIGLVTGYGLTETSPVLTSNRPDAWKRGSVGQPVPGVEIRLAGDGEVLARGPNVMQGYYRDPEGTSDVLRGEWFHTGDLGRIDDDGFLFLTGRKKEMIITTGGRNIPPAAIENDLLADPWIHQVVVVGDGRDYLIALIVLNVDEAAHSPDIPDAQDATAWESLLLKRLRDRLQHRSHYEQIQKVFWIREPFSIENGLLTPKGSVRRHAVELRYAQAIERMYRRPDARQ